MSLRGSLQPPAASPLAHPLGGTVSVRVDYANRILEVRITGALSLVRGLEYRRLMVAAFDELRRRRPWGILSDRRDASVQEPEIQALMSDVFTRANVAGRTHAAVLARDALAHLQLKRLAVEAGIVQAYFASEAEGRAWLIRELGPVR